MWMRNILIDIILSGDEEALLTEYGSRERNEAFYGGASREITERLLTQIRYEKKGIMLDTGHLMCTNPDIASEEEGIAYIQRCLDAHGPLCRYIKGVHLHKSLSGPYVKSVLADPPDLPKDYDERIGMAYMHVFQIDQHRPFSCKEVKGLIRQIAPEYLTHEFVTNDLAQHKAYLRVQTEALL